MSYAKGLGPNSGYRSQRLSATSSKTPSATRCRARGCEMDHKEIQIEDWSEDGRNLWVIDNLEGEGWYLPSDIAIEHPALSVEDLPEGKTSDYAGSEGTTFSTANYSMNPVSGAFSISQGVSYGEQRSGSKQRIIPHSLPPIFKYPQVAKIYKEDATRSNKQKIFNPMKTGGNTNAEILKLLILPCGRRGYLSYREIKETCGLYHIGTVIDYAWQLGENIDKNAFSNTPGRITIKERERFHLLLNDRLNPAEIAEKQGVSEQAVQKSIGSVRKKLGRFQLFP